MAFVLGWLVAQTGKLLGDLVSITGLTVFFIIKNGIFANITVLALAMTIIVVYDAVNVRYAVGEQGKLLNIIADDRNRKGKKLRIVEGHTIPQVIVGAIIGVMIGLFCGFVL